MMSAALPSMSDIQYFELPSNSHRIAYSVVHLSESGSTGKRTLIILVNGLGLPQAWWQPVIEILEKDFGSIDGHHEEAVSLVTYDRFGQGLSAPTSAVPIEKHDIISSVRELDEVINYVETERMEGAQLSKLILVAQSIGVPLARLFCQEYPQRISALLALDSNMANTDFVSIMPDPGSPDFVSIMPDPGSPDFDADRNLPEDTTIEQLRWTRENYRKMFHPSTPNPEGLDRSSLPSLLPRADSPVLVGPAGEPLLIAVVGHDPATFAEESLRISTRGLTERYIQPAWERYNAGVLKIGTSSKAVVYAPGSGHFIQKDNPRFVADELIELWQRCG